MIWTEPKIDKFFQHFISILKIPDASVFSEEFLWKLSVCISKLKHLQKRHAVNTC